MNNEYGNSIFIIKKVERHKNNDNLENYGIISKKGKTLLFFSLISVLLIFLSNYILSSDWYYALKLAVLINPKANTDLINLPTLIMNINWILIIIITILSIIFYFTEKKTSWNYKIYTLNIFAGILNILFGNVGIIPYIYLVNIIFYSFKNISIKNKNRIGIISDILLIFLSLAVILFNVLV